MGKQPIRSFHPGHGNGLNGSLNNGVKITSWEIIKQMSSYVWPKGKPALKLRVVIALAFLLAAKVSYFKKCSYFILIILFLIR